MYSPKTVLEFGCGEYSTGFFVGQGASVTSVEMQDEGWAEKVKGMYPDVNMVVCLGKDSWQELAYEERYDLIFVDGHGGSRPECVNWAKDHTDIIVAHDTQEPWYGWERVDLNPEEWEIWMNVTVEPWTTVFVRRES